MSDTAQAGYFAVAPQAAQGTPATAAKLGAAGMRATSVNVSGESEVSTPDPEVGGGRSRELDGALYGGFKVGGSLEAYLRFKVLPYLLMLAGWTPAAPTQIGTTGAYRHVFTPAASPTWGTVRTSWGQDRAVRTFLDCLVESLEFAVESEGRATVSAEFLGLSETFETAPPAAPTYPAPDAIANYLGSAVTLDGLGTYRFASLGFSVANNLSDDEFVIGSRTLDDSTPGQREVGMSGTIRLGNNTPSVTDLYRAAMYGDKSATEPGASDPWSGAALLTFGSTRSIGAGPEKYRVEVDIPELVLGAFPLEASGDGPLEVSIEGVAYANAGAPEATITVVNDQATAYTA